jgi:hypothetical protein
MSDNSGVPSLRSFFRRAASQRLRPGRSSRSLIVEESAVADGKERAHRKSHRGFLFSTASERILMTATIPESDWESPENIITTPNTSEQEDVLVPMDSPTTVVLSTVSLDSASASRSKASPELLQEQIAALRASLTRDTTSASPPSFRRPVLPSPPVPPVHEQQPGMEDSERIRTGIPRMVVLQEEEEEGTDQEPCNSLAHLSSTDEDEDFSSYQQHYFAKRRSSRGSCYPDHSSHSGSSFCHRKPKARGSYDPFYYSAEDDNDSRIHPYRSSFCSEEPKSPRSPRRSLRSDYDFHYGVSPKLKSPRAHYQSPRALPSPTTAAPKMIEISPGEHGVLHGAAETWKAVQNDDISPVVCISCNESDIMVMNSVSFVVCPHCKCVSPTPQPGNRRVGLGFTFQDLGKWQEELLEMRHQI